MNPLGIYFGPRMVCIAETKNKLLVNSINIPHSRFMGQDSQEKVPEEIKISILFKEELKRAHMDSPEASIVVSGRDLIIRTFDMPVIPQSELYNALTFEVRKYIPFRVEDLIFDFQVLFDKPTKKNFVLFAGIKKDILHKYLAILKQLSMKAVTIDYSGFSVLRLLSVPGINQRGITAIVDIDLVEEDEINFMVLQNGFPLFSRDIVLPSESNFDSVKTGKFDVSISMDKFKSELRVSLDFYHRKFPSKRIERIFFVCSEELSGELLAFAKEKNLTAQVIDLKRFLPKSSAFSSSLCKAYGGSLSKAIKTNIRIDLLNTRFKKPGITEKITGTGIASQLLPELKLSPKVAAVGALICAAVFAYGIFQRLPLEEETRRLISIRPQVSAVKPDLSVADLTSFNTKFKKRIESLRKIFNNKVYVTPLLNMIPKLLPDGLWLTGLTYRGEPEKAEMLVRGVAYFNDADKEMQAINQFRSELQNKKEVSEKFGNIEISSVDHGMFKKSAVTNFTIILRNYKE
jgi:hypothetical protein